MIPVFVSIRLFFTLVSFPTVWHYRFMDFFSGYFHGSREPFPLELSIPFLFTQLIHMCFFFTSFLIISCSFHIFWVFISYLIHAPFIIEFVLIFYFSLNFSHNSHDHSHHGGGCFGAVQTETPRHERIRNRGRHRGPYRSRWHFNRWCHRYRGPLSESVRDKICPLFLCHVVPFSKPTSSQQRFPWEYQRTRNGERP